MLTEKKYIFKKNIENWKKQLVDHQEKLIKMVNKDDMENDVKRVYEKCISDTDKLIECLEKEIEKNEKRIHRIEGK